ncbi:proton-coupled zinc antiporter SLC30A9, mitochondrial [Topomyia yanbarensis]|uniref:proton-coupled zinc antiporter SLC30A9, mitochondrial n=1 Tax=Topomyia yanbarensis TaxID=2498891 RepID=UPI00273C1E23|nr:proton-coupled zinc antiporter SLC30A9, mitochondrial [Topomyia yanbarensis]XP_058832350.1 proton-coupled zinc antiporter SLC30A9, mitochondrial [Topomyia yanbarensis]
MIHRVVDAAKLVGTRQNIVSHMLLSLQRNNYQIGVISLRKLSVLYNTKLSSQILAGNCANRVCTNGQKLFSITRHSFSSQTPTTKGEKDQVGESKETTIEINTKSGKLLVTTTTNADSKLQDVIIEKPKPDNLQNDEEISKSTAIPLLSDEEKSRLALADQLAEKNRQLAKKRIRVDFSRSSLERNFITPVRAMSDFLLKPSDLESLPKTKRRSPYEQEPPITVYWRKDVEAKAIEVWGSRENLLKECLKREIEKKRHQQNIFTVKRRLRDYRREIGSRTNIVDAEPGLFGKSGRVVLTAIAINATNCLFKFGAWLYTGSHSMFAETIHSLADTINQLILAYGIHKSTQIADSDHPYGYSNMKYVSSLISGVGIFCVGTGLSFYHGIMGLTDPHPIDDFFWAFFILGGSLVSEGATLLVAINSCRSGAKALGMTFKDYVIRSQDPCVNVVLTEDAAAVLSVVLAATCMGLSTYTGSPLPDAVGSLLVGCMLGAVASFIIYTNVAALVGRSIRQENLDRINGELESDIMIRAIHDVKGIDMGNSLVRYKAEMDFDGRELTRVYLDKQDLNVLLEEVRTFQTIDELEAYMLKHGENIVDLMGGEIDRIEMKLRKKFPEIRHCDLEIL